MSESRSDNPVAGHAYASGYSRRHDAVLRAGAREGTLALADAASGAPLCETEAGAAIRHPRMGRMPSEVELARGWRFETADHDGLDALLGLPPAHSRHRWEAFGPHLLLVAVAVIVSAYAVWRWGIGALVAVAVFATPPSLKQAIDESNLAALDQFMAEPSQLSQAEQQRVATIFAQLTGHTGVEAGGLALHFRHMPRVGPNAFALPGGTLIVTDALVRDFPDEDVLAGVIGHEIAHVLEQHGLRQVYRSLSTYLLVALIAGDVGPVLEDALLEGGLLLSLAYSREYETDADEIGVSLAARAGYDPAGLATFFETLAKKGGEPPQWLSTHPASEGRAERVRELAAEGE